MEAGRDAVLTRFLWFSLTIFVAAQAKTKRGIPASSVKGAVPLVAPGTEGTHVDYEHLARTCQHANGGTRASQLVWGLNFYTQTPEGCCEACKKKDGCNIWTYCADADGCGGLFQPRECWLRHRSVADDSYNFVFVDGRSPGFVTGFAFRDEVPLAIDLYYAVGEFQSSVNSGKQVESLWQFFPTGDFRYVTIGDCAHLCELYRSRGCDSFHFMRAIDNDLDRCTLSSGSSKLTVSTNLTHVTTFFRDESVARPSGITAIDDYWTYETDGDVYRAVDSSGTMLVLTGSGLRSSYEAVTLEECSDICSITAKCVAFEYQPAGRGICILKNKPNLKVKSDGTGWQIYWSNDVKGPAVVLDDNKSAGDEVPNTLWVVLGIGFCIVILLLVTLMGTIYRKQQRKRIVQRKECRLVGPSSPPLSEVNLTLDYDTLEIDRQNPLGSGSFGVVYKGMYQNKRVAVKLLASAFQMGPYLRSFEEEIKILCRVRHKNIVLCYGGNIVPPNICIVEELMEMTLGDLLYPLNRKETYRMSIRGILQLIMEVSAALVHIHPIIIHRDLKPGNILLDKKKHAKIADFGLSRIKASSYLSTEGPMRGTVSYMAPECFMENGHGISEKVDIFALGCIMWECLSGQPPWANLANHIIIANNVAHLGLRPEIPVDTPNSLAEMIERCWAHSPNDRPTAEDIFNWSSALLG